MIKISNIPNKADGDILYAANLFKVMGIDNTGGTTTTEAETTLSTISLAANQASACIIVMAVCTLTNALAVGNYTCNFKIKVGGVEKSTLAVVRSTQTSQYLGAMPVTCVAIDTSSTFTNALDVIVTATLGGPNPTYPGTATVKYVVVLGV